MCPATHILFWLLTFLRLKIYLQPLVPLFFGEFISYAFQKNPKNKFKKTQQKLHCWFFFFFFLRITKFSLIIISEPGCLQLCRVKQGLLLFQECHAAL